MLGDSAESPRFVETLPRRGYRFIAPVEGTSPPSTKPPEELPTIPPKTSRRTLYYGLALLGLTVVFGRAQGSKPAGRGRRLLRNLKENLLAGAGHEWYTFPTVVDDNIPA